MSQQAQQNKKCIVQNKHSSKALTSEDLPSLYGQAGQIISQLDISINRCKKYNEAKINRKYQIIIKDLEAEIRKLTQKLKLEQQARSPTKKHISDILDKLVAYKDRNQILTQQLSQYKEKVIKLEQKLQSQSNALLKIQNQQPKTSIERLPAINTNGNLVDSVKQYLKDKQKVKMMNNLPTSNLQKFLNAHRNKMWNWNIGNLLEQLDKWAEGVKERQDVDMWRIRSGIARKFSQYIDDSNSLITPSHSKAVKKILSPIPSEPARGNKFTAFDFKPKRNAESSLS